MRCPNFERQKSVVLAVQEDSRMHIQQFRILVLITILTGVSHSFGQGIENQFERLSIQAEKFKKEQQIDSFLKVEQQLLSLAKQLQNQNAIAQAESDIGLAYKLKGNYPLALRYLFKALPHFERNNMREKLVVSWGNIGTVFDMQGELEKALSYYQKSLDEARKLNMNQSVSYQYSNIGTVFTMQGKFDKAIQNFKNALVIDSLAKDQRSFVKNKMNLASVFAEQGEIKESLVMYNEALTVFSALNDLEGITLAYLNISASQAELGNKKAAYEMLSKSFVASQNVADLGLKSQLEWIAHQIYESFGDASLALEHYKQHIALRDELYNKENTRKSLESELNYQFQKKKLKQQFAYENRISKVKADQTFYTGLLLFLMVLSAVVALAIFAYQKIKNQRKELALKTQHAKQLINSQERERQRIAKELHDSVGQNVLFLRNQMVKQGQLEMVQTVDETLTEIRSISKDLYPSQLEIYGFVAAVQTLLEKARKGVSVFISADLELFPTNASAEAQIHLYRIVQECLSNALKYAKATAIRLTLEQHESSYSLVFQDNGVGFDSKQLMSSSKMGMGLLNLQERIHLIDGNWELEAVENKGTKHIFVFTV